MKLSRITTIVSALVTLCFVATRAIGADTISKPIYTDYPPYLCVGGGFVAMAGISYNDPLIVIAISGNGIEAPQTIPLAGDEVLGMRCDDYTRIELLVRDRKSGRLINQLFTNESWHSPPRPFHEEQRQDVPQGASTPPAVKHRIEFFRWSGNRPGVHARGDWYVEVGGGRPNHWYEVHFVSTYAPGETKLAVTLVEETLDKKKITKSVPLVFIDAFDCGGHY